MKYLRQKRAGAYASLGYVPIPHLGNIPSIHPSKYRISSTGRPGSMFSKSGELSPSADKGKSEANPKNVEDCRIQRLQKAKSEIGVLYPLP